MAQIHKSGPSWYFGETVLLIWVQIWDTNWSNLLYRSDILDSLEFGYICNQRWPIFGQKINFDSVTTDVCLGTIKYSSNRC